MLVPGFFLLETDVSFLGVLILIVAGVFILGSLVPGWAVTFRRLHDTDHSGLWILGGAIPFVGLIASVAVLIFTVIPGDQIDNRYGRSPYQSKHADNAIPAPEVPQSSNF